MSNNQENKISYFAAHITTIVSVSLVLIIVGVISLVSVCGANVSTQIKEQVEVNVVLKDSVSDLQAMPLFEEIKNSRYTNTIRFITKEAALKNWTLDTGEDLEEIFGVNPLSPEISLTVKADYSHPDSLKRIVAELESHAEVEGVARHNSDEMIQAIDNIENMSLILGAIALAMTIISFVLINNTVHLTIYSRRFTIHTMQLVGATNGFIRRPFILNNMLSGVVSAVVAALVLTGALEYIRTCEMPVLMQYVGWSDVAVIFAGLFLFGALICGFAAWVATTKYLRKDYDQLFK